MSQKKHILKLKKENLDVLFIPNHRHEYYPEFITFDMCSVEKGFTGTEGTRV